MKNNLSEPQKAKIKHLTTVVVAGLLFVLSLSKERYGLALICLMLFVLGISLYSSIGDEER